ncbi:MAG: DinB family protein [Chitinophagaceae bacterium]|nr:MAG: DinB family protein [Chitinophagaceae bacterium]
MKNYLDALETQRTLLLEKTEHLNTPQYNVIPPGYNNNIIWNMGHTLVVSESYLYRNTPFARPAHPFDTAVFKRGTRPDQALNDFGISLVRKSLHDTVPVFQKMLEESGHEINRLITEEDLRFVLFHESIHYRTISALMQYSQ